MSLIGYIKGENAGPVRIVATYTASFGGNEFGEQELYARSTGDYDWTPFEAKIDIPPDDPAISPAPGKPFDPKLRTDNARAVRITGYMGRTDRAEGIARFDDFALVSWTSERPPDGVNPYDFIRLADLEQPTTVTVTLASWRRK